MPDNSTGQKSRPPIHRGSGPASAESAQLALTSILANLPVENNRQQCEDRTAWLSYLDGSQPPPIPSEIGSKPQFVGQALATFVLNSKRRQFAREGGQAREIRSALGESVSSVSHLIREIAQLRSNANSVLNEIEDRSEQMASNLPESLQFDQLQEIRSMIRRLDVVANEKRRSINSRLASLRMELLDLPEFTVASFREVKSIETISRYMDHYVATAKQLGEIVTVVNLGLPPETVPGISLGQFDKISDVFRTRFQRQVDFVSKLSQHRLLAILIDTPAPAVADLLRQFGDDVDSTFPDQNLTDDLLVNIVEVDPEASGPIDRQALFERITMWVPRTETIPSGRLDSHTQQTGRGSEESTSKPLRTFTSE